MLKKLSSVVVLCISSFGVSEWCHKPENKGEEETVKTYVDREGGREYLSDLSTLREGACFGVQDSFSRHNG